MGIIICPNCGNKSEYLINYCDRCGSKVISFSFENNFKHQENEKEKEQLDKLINILAIKHNKKDFIIKKTSEEYTTLMYKEYDLIRIKVTNNVKWIKLFITDDMVEKYKNNIMFENHKNKNEVFWKTNFEYDFNKYMEIIESACSFIETH